MQIDTIQRHISTVLTTHDVFGTRVFIIPVAFINKLSSEKKWQSHGSYSINHPFFLSNCQTSILGLSINSLCGWKEFGKAQVPRAARITRARQGFGYGHCKDAMSVNYIPFFFCQISNFNYQDRSDQPDFWTSMLIFFHLTFLLPVPDFCLRVFKLCRTWTYFYVCENTLPFFWVWGWGRSFLLVQCKYLYSFLWVQKTHR